VACRQTVLRKSTNSLPRRCRLETWKRRLASTKTTPFSFHPVHLQPNRFVGRKCFAQVASEFLALNPTLTTESKKVIEAGDIALVTGDWTLTGKGPDGDVRLSGTFTDVMHRQSDGTWLFVIDNPDGVA
jgi:Domain of unknown function (DUF4440)